MATKAQEDFKTAQIIALRSEGKMWPEIARAVGFTPQRCWHRVKVHAPDLIGAVANPPGPKGGQLTGCPENLYNLKPRPTPPWVPPKTGSESGFIRPIPLSRLTGAR